MKKLFTELFRRHYARDHEWLKSKILSIGAVLVAFSVGSSALASPVTSGLNVWLDATDGDTLYTTTDRQSGTNNPGQGDDILSWTDKSGNNNHFIHPEDWFGEERNGSIPATYESTGINGGSSLQFDFRDENSGAATKYTTGFRNENPLSIAANDQRTVFFVMNYPEASGVTDNDLAGADGFNKLDLNVWHPDGDRPERLRVRNDDSIFSGANTVPYNTDEILVVQGSGSRTAAWLNGGENPIIDSPTNHFGWSMEDLGIGTAENGNKAFSGQLSEVLIYDRELSEGEMTEVGQYLGEKYNVSFEVIPEPSTLALLGLAGLLLMKRRRF